MPYQPLLLAVVIPVYNEAEIIETVIRSWGDFLKHYFADETLFRIIVVDDGAKDATPQILDRAALSMPCLQVAHQANGGHGAAVLHGYQLATGLAPEWIFQVDSDNQFLPDDFPKLWERRGTSNFLLGNRQQRHDDLHRLFITRVVLFLNLLLFRVRIADSNIPYRLIKGAYLKRLLAVLPPAPFAPNIFLSVLARRNGNDLAQIPVTHIARKTGRTSIVKWKLAAVCLRSARELAVFSFTLRPRLRALKEENLRPPEFPIK